MPHAKIKLDWRKPSAMNRQTLYAQRIWGTPMWDHPDASPNWHSPQGIQRELIARYGNRFQPTKLKGMYHDYNKVAVGYLLPERVVPALLPFTAKNIDLHSKALARNAG